MKTAMQELIQWIDNDFRKQSTIPTIQQLKNKAEYLLEKEKEQIMKAYCDGFDELLPFHENDYYNQTYKK
jgi:hypothetical protein